MCTTGLLRIGEGDYLLFKNKDFGRRRFDDVLVVESDVFGVAGITTWAGSDPDLDQFSGFSIGANDTGVLACDSNVRTLDGHANYDELVEIALRRGTDAASCADAVREAVARRPYMWGNLMLIDSTDQVAIEVRGNTVDVQTLGGPTARTNHHLVLGDQSHNDDTSTSLARLAAAEYRVATATTLDDVFALLGSHDDGDTGICNHSAHETVYSYVLRRRHGQTTLYVSQGKPCEGAAYKEIGLPLGADWSADTAAVLRSAYPSQAVIEILES
jgi:hypothetical protein